MLPHESFQELQRHAYRPVFPCDYVYVRLTKPAQLHLPIFQSTICGRFKVTAGINADLYVSALLARAQ